MDVSVIIVTFNSLRQLGPCLDSLKRQKLFNTTEVIVVDNASSDGTPRIVHERYPWVRLLAGRENVGYSRGVNLGIREAKGEYFLILNPDTIVGEDAIENLVEFMKQVPAAGIVGPKLVFEDGSIQYSCRRFYTWRVLLLRRTFFGKIFKNSKAISDHLMLDFDHESTREVDWILGACLMVRKRAVESVGLMDERFFLYFEDVDWCYRMKQKDWKVFYYPGSVVVHAYARQSAQSVINRSLIAHLASLIRYYEKWSAIPYFFKKYREVGKILVFVLADIIAFNLAFVAAYSLRASLHDIFTNPIFPMAAYRRFVYFENLLFVFTFFSLGLYRIRRDTLHVDEFFQVSRAIILASILLMASTYLSHIRTYSRLVVAFLVPFAVIFDWMIRTIVRRVHKRLLGQKIDLKRVCIVGPSPDAKALEQKLLREVSLGIEVAGFVTTNDGDEGQRSGSLGGLSTLEEVVDRYRIQEVIFLPNAVPEEQLAEFIAMGRRKVLDVTVLTDYSKLVTQKAVVANLAGRPVIAYRRDTRYVLDRLVKRLVDMVVGGIFLVVSFPFYVVYSLYSYVRGRKTFSSEERLGLGGETFSVPIAGAAGRDGPSDIVNLPLFWLVLVGKMSMVGPYSLPPRDAGRLVRKARFRFEVRPGVTGYWRVGSEREYSLDEILAQDANYWRNWSLVEDVKILVMTFGNMLFGKKRILTVAGRED